MSGGKFRKAVSGGEWRRSRKSPRKRKDGSRGHAWKVRYRDPDRVERSRTFGAEADARRFASKIEVSVNEGTYIDPTLGRTLLKDWTGDWLEASEPALKPHTISGYRTRLRKHVVPALGSMQLAKVRAIDVRRFVADLSNAGLSPSQVRSTYFPDATTSRRFVSLIEVARRPKHFLPMIGGASPI